MSDSSTKVTRLPKTKADLDRRKDEAQRIKEFRNLLGYNREAFARACGVSRISAFAWESGKTSPQPRNWKEMAKLAVKAAPSAALWLWEKAGIEREDFQYLFPEFERIAKDSEQRVQQKLELSPSESKLVPLIRSPLRGEWRIPPAPEQVEDYLSFPRYLIQTNSDVVAMRISTEFVSPIFSVGGIIVVDTSEVNILSLEGQLVIGSYLPNAETINFARMFGRGREVAPHLRGRWPFLEEGVYVGWLRTDPPNDRGRRPMTLHSVKIDSPEAISAVHEFSVPVGMICEPQPGEKIVARDSELKLLGHVICWIASDMASAEEGSGSHGIEVR
jgi:DNA-binding XRE family transcriptional regulator